MPPSLHTRRSFIATATAAAVGLCLKSAFGESGDLAALTLKRASELLRSKASSPVELTQACLKRIELYNSALNAFITVTGEQALAAAQSTNFRAGSRPSYRHLARNIRCGQDKNMTIRLKERAEFEDFQVAQPGNMSAATVYIAIAPFPLAPRGGQYPCALLLDSEVLRQLTVCPKDWEA